MAWLGAFVGLRVMIRLDGTGWKTFVGGIGQMGLVMADRS